MNSEEKIQELETKVAELTALVERLVPQRQAASVAPAEIRVEAVGADERRASRRNLLKLAGAAAVGTAAATVGGVMPAAAANGDSILLGEDGGANNTFTNPTGINFTGTGTTAVLFKVQDGTTWPATSSGYPAAIGGWASQTGQSRNGVYGYTQFADRAGVVGYGSISVVGSLGGRFEGARAAINLVSSGTVAQVTAAAHRAGDIIRTEDGSLWYVAADGTPGTLRKLAGPSAAGNLHLLAAPKRVYSSRSEDEPVAVGPKTPLSAATRTIDCKQGSSGVPAGATGVVLNVTAIAASVNGYLSVSPGSTGFSGTSTLNWTANGAVVANGVTVGTGPNATIDVTIGGGGTANFIVDVMGYYL